MEGIMPPQDDDANLVVESQPLEPKSEKSRILRYDEVFDFKTRSIKLIRTSKGQQKSYDKRKPVLIVIRKFDQRGRVDSVVIQIASSLIVSVLLDINKDVEGLRLRSTPAIVTPQLLYHSYGALQERLRTETESESIEQSLVDDLVETVRYIEQEYAEVIANMRNLIPEREITWDLLWAFFPPNTLVYHYHELTEQHQVMRLQSIYKAGKTLQSNETWVLRCNIIADDGNSFGFAEEPLSQGIPRYEESRKIYELPVFPLQYHSDKENIQKQLIERGKRYSKITASSHVAGQTNGPAMFEREIGDKTVQFKFTSHGRAVVDAAAFRSFNPNVEFIPEVYRTISREALTDTEYMICSPVALGFSLGNKRWGGLAMSRLCEVQWNSQAFDDLVLEQKIKDLVYALVNQNSSNDDEFDDVITGKGKGVVALLGGPPGSGKTLTAEAVAEVTRRPLYVVSAGELGVEPDHVDERLALILQLAHKWDAVLLLDEADVFLQERDTIDVNRNALVSIFLRQLEYFQGVLILTTNRDTLCDPAFESRIHIRLKYKELSEAARKRIWSLFLTKARGRNESLHVAVTDEEVEILAKKQLNGRQIKNTVSAARCIAKEKRESLRNTHIEMVLETVYSMTEEDLLV